MISKKITVSLLTLSLLFTSLIGMVSAAPNDTDSSSSTSSKAKTDIVSISSISNGYSGWAIGTGSPYTYKRSGPGTNYSIVGQLYYGDQIYVYSTTNGWAKIVESSDTVYYISASYLKPYNP